MSRIASGSTDQEDQALEADRDGKEDRGERGQLAEEGRPLERQSDREGRKHERRQEGVLRHEHAGVDERRHQQGQSHRDEREDGCDQLARPQEERDRGRRHHDDVDRLGERVRRSHRMRQPGGRDQRGIDDVVDARRRVTD